ncbi:unnamed protein product [Paramecium octaurelia]|uniref:Transmembrane protein n=1 Tax=Paramecium octaurelia TaxID=43137 RepID=A0A8S1WTD1_PAROT|nr:unnamed protein product [Paramecium octaurelia]
MKFNGTQLFNYNWKKFKIHESNKLQSFIKELIKFAFLLIALQQNVAILITLSIYWMLNQENKKPNQLIILIGLFRYAFHLILLHQHLQQRMAICQKGNKCLNQMDLIELSNQYASLLMQGQLQLITGCQDKRSIQVGHNYYINLTQIFVLI